MSQQRKYTVAVPISGVIFVDVEAASEDEAIDAALESDQLDRDNIEEWDAHRQIVQGNVCYASQWKAEVVSDNGPVEGDDE